MDAVDFGIGHGLAVMHQGMHDLARAPGREAPVGAEGDDQELGPGAGQGARQIAIEILRRLDFLSIGTNDLIQYTLAIDRADESVAHLYDPLHPAVLQLVALTIAQCQAQGKDVSVCGEMAGDISLTRLLLGMGLRSFSMHPAQILAVKQEVLRADTGKLAVWAAQVMAADEPGLLMKKHT